MPPTQSCSTPKCLSCQLFKQKLWSTGVKTTKSVIEKDGVLKFNKYEPGDLDFLDQFNVHTPGWQLSGYGCEGGTQSLHGGTIFTDAASNYVYAECQTHIGAGKMVMAKTGFEQLCWNIAGLNIKGYHSDNGVYTAKDFGKTACQRISLSPSLALEQSTRMPWPNATSKQYATGRGT